MNQIKPGVWYNEEHNEIYVVTSFHQVFVDTWAMIVLTEQGEHSCFIDYDKTNEIYIGEW